jgi:tetratricopeptide (TPR) repeat protein
MRFACRFAAPILALFAGAAACAAEPPPKALSSSDLLRLGEQARSGGSPRDAETIYRALIADPDPDMRAEARFRLGMMLAGAQRYREAATLFRALLDEKPDANRVRLELARVLALMGEEDLARRQLRQAQAAGLPADVAIVVGRFSDALRSQRPFGGSAEIALVPDSNINRATRAATLDTVIAPLVLDKDARGQTGIGLKLGGEAYGRMPIGLGTALLVRGYGSGLFYRQHGYDDLAGSVLVGPEFRRGGDRIRPAAGLGRRWYGGRLYARTRSATVNWLHPIGRRSQIICDLSATRADYARNRLQDGSGYDLSVAFEHGFRPRTGGSITLSASRQTARDPGYATTSAGAVLLLWQDLGRATVYASAAYRHLGSDARLLLYPQARTDDYMRAGGGVAWRRLSLLGLAPVVRVAYERNRSTVGLYDYRRVAVDIGVVSAF